VNDTVRFGRGDDPARRSVGYTNIDYTGRIGGGPLDRGFDSYFGVDVPNFPPYTWFEGDRLAQQPTVEKPQAMYGHPGYMAPGWKLEAMIPEFTKRARDYIHAQAGSDKPFFLYFPLTSPHSPVVPNAQFKRTSGAGNYGDFVCEVDWVVGEVMEALEQSGQRENSLVIFTSDNGPELQMADDEGAYRRAHDRRHYSMGPLRGIKRDAWEGGHRVPFVASWPAVTPKGATCDQLVVLGDLMASCAEVLGTELPAGSGEDSVSMLPLLRGQTDAPTRESAVHHSMNGSFAVRKGEWVFIDAPSGDNNDEPAWFRAERGYVAHEHDGELFNLHEDLPERVNRYAERPDLVRELSALLTEAKLSGAHREPARPTEALTE
jgi:arylsulfatase A-like enzyme